MQPPGVVFSSTWLAKNGYSNGLLQRYRKSHWLESIGNGAMIRHGEAATVWGALCALQSQLNMPVHAGGRTALDLLGRSHSLPVGPAPIILFGANRVALPEWFTKYRWTTPFHFHSYSFLPHELGLVPFGIRDFEVMIASPARAMMECLLLARDETSLLECASIMEGLNNLDPVLVQALLEQCTSIKVKRLFLFLASRAGHAWFNRIEVSRIQIGKGKRSLVPGGAYVPEYQLVVPRQWVEDEYPAV